MARYMFRELVVDSRTGLNPRKNFTLGTGSNYYITIKDIHDGKIIITDKTDRVSDDAIAIIKRRSRIKNGDVLFTSIGRIGETAIVTNKDDTWDVNESVFVFTLNTSLITQDFFCILFQSKNVQEKLARDSSGSTFKSIKMNQLEKMSFDIPDIEEQKQTAGIMRKINKLIALRKEQLAALDQLVKSRFIELFGDVSQNPRGYPVKSFDEISTLITDGEHATPRRTDRGVYLLSARNVLNHAIQLNDVDYIDDDEYNRISRRVIPQAGDVLISCSGSIGRCCVVPDGLKFQMVRSAALIRFDKTINPIFAEWLITSDDLQQQIAQSATQSSQANLFQGKIRKLHGYVPPIELQNLFAAFVEQTGKSKLAIQRSLDELETLKKALMQKYFG